MRRRSNLVRSFTGTGRTQVQSAEASESLVHKQMQRHLEQAAAEIHQLRDMVARQRAEFDNFRKRTMKEKEHIRDAAREDVLTKLLPVVDNFDRALCSISDTTDATAVRDGVQMVASQFSRILESEGLERIQALNAPFDPNIHEAIATEERTDVPESHVCEEMLPGYRFRDKVVRAAMVKVAKSPAHPAEPAST